MRLNYFASVCSFIILLDSGASAQLWRSADLSSVGWSVERLKAAHAVATSRKRQPNADDHVAGRVISDASDGIITTRRDG
ncbi:hypothetical protein [Rhizobium sp. FKY42]|uniref:hypothetical protein n=1 Tax=Rhizobium sp. FKY42 TaxID=2562310 RepID=UPI0010C11424|nr:hypothetical protein [Rhizobium sp. FKY42]